MPIKQIKDYNIAHFQGQNSTNACIHTSAVLNKHYHPKFRRERWQKTYKIDIPDYDKLRRESNMTMEELRSHTKKTGQPPPRTFKETDLTISASGTIFEPYVPPEGDGRSMLLSGEGTKQKFTEFEKKGKSYLQARKIRQFDEDFNVKTFPEMADDIYKKAQFGLNEYAFYK